MQNTNKFIFIILVLTVLLSLISCASTNQLNTIEPELVLTNTVLPQITPTMLSSLTPRIPLPTNTNMPLPTLIAVPTLSPENAYLELKNYLKNGCELPCWAGITPGETLLIDASKTLVPFLSISNWNFLSEQGGSIHLIYPKDELSIYLSVNLLAPKNESHVQLQRISTHALQEIDESSYQSDYDAESYHELLGSYSMQNILALYGKPSEIYMTVEMYEYEPGAPDFVTWWLMYPEKGIITKYTANAELIDGKVHGCPSKTFVDLWLFSPYDDDEYKKDLISLDKDFLGYVLPTPLMRTKPISEALGMSINKFYEMFSQPNDKCLETPYDIWPKW